MQIHEIKWPPKNKVTKKIINSRCSSLSFLFSTESQEKEFCAHLNNDMLKEDI